MNILLIVASLFLFTGSLDPSNNNFRRPDISINIPDTISKFVVDDYPLTYDMIKASAHSRKSGALTDVEGAWFSNDSLKQTLVFVLYTDGHRLHTFHFVNNDIPPGLIDKMEIYGNNDIATDKEKQKDFRGFLTQTTKIDKSYFTTDKGFKMGDSKTKALKVYGKPTKIKMENGIERCEWDFIGDISYDDKTDRGKPVAESSFGHQTTMFFRNNKLIGLIFHNDIP